MGYGLRADHAMILSFFSGATMMGCLGVGLFFLRYWKRTGDRFFVLFSVAFGILALERFLVILLELPSEMLAWVYVPRLFSFLLILAAIFDKNRSSRT